MQSANQNHKMYYTLATRGKHGKWSPQFGDYDQDVVLQEAIDEYHVIGTENVAILVSGSSQKEINAVVDLLNHISKRG